MRECLLEDLLRGAFDND